MVNYYHTKKQAQAKRRKGEIVVKKTFKRNRKGKLPKSEWFSLYHLKKRK